MKFDKVTGVSKRGFVLFSTVEVEDEFCEDVSSRRGSAHFFFFFTPFPVCGVFTYLGETCSSSIDLSVRRVVFQY